LRRAGVRIAFMLMRFVLLSFIWVWNWNFIFIFLECGHVLR
jgi:hypothetical protein